MVSVARSCASASSQRVAWRLSGAQLGHRAEKRGLKTGRSGSLLPIFLVPVGGLLVTLGGSAASPLLCWPGPEFYLRVSTSAAARRNARSWPRGVPSLDSCGTTTTSLSSAVCHGFTLQWRVTSAMRSGPSEPWYPL